MKKILIIGAGLSGLTLAERFAQTGDQVLILDQRPQLGGNCYDYQNQHKITVQKYGPHIFHTDDQEVYRYLCQFTSWINYQHRVLGSVDGQLVPIPFNLTTLEKTFSDSQGISKKLVAKFGREKKVPILELKKTKDSDLKAVADFVYQKIFLNYTLKQWGVKPEEIDPAVTARVPVFVSKDDRYFQDKYQGLPKPGFSQMLAQMAGHKNITIKLNTKYKPSKEDKNYDLIFYTGPVDEYFNYKFGPLGYRYINLKIETKNQASYQPAAVVNYPNKYKFTRITEFKKLTQARSKQTTICKEYPGTKGFQAYPMFDSKNNKIFKKYQKEAHKLKLRGIYFVGRLAEYKYYDMDDAVRNALDLFAQLK